VVPLILVLLFPRSEEKIHPDPETGEEIPQGDMLSGNDDDPARCAGRIMDWEGFLDTHNPRYEAMVCDMAQGHTRQRNSGKVWAQQLLGARAERKARCGSA